MSRDFGYVNARVRGMSSRLLGADVFQAALAARDFRAFTSVLAQSPYGPALEEAQTRGTGLSAVDRALARDFHQTTRSMLSFADGEPRRMIAALLRRYDVEDLKAVARAKHAGRAPDEMGETISGAGDLRPALLQALVSAPDLPSAAQALAIAKHPLGPPFVRAARAYASDGDLHAFEVTLDKAYFASLVDTAEERGTPEAFRAHVRREVDAANLRTALKIVGRGGDLGTFFMPGGKEVSREEFLQLAAQGVEGLSQLRTATFSAVSDAKDRAGAEVAIRASLDAAARTAALRDPLGIGVVLRYLRAKETEAAKLRLLARGAYYGVPRSELEKELGHA